MVASSEDLQGLAEDARSGFRHMRSVACTMFIMRDQNGGDERMEGALDLLASRLEELADDAENAFERVLDAAMARTSGILAP